MNCRESVAVSVGSRATAAQVKQELMLSVNALALAQVLNEIRKILANTISCPHCRAPFLDFSGCLALTCAGCSKDFCGVCCCQHSSTKDKHEAVRECVERLPQEERTMNDFAKLMCVPSAVLQV